MEASLSAFSRISNSSLHSFCTEITCTSVVCFKARSANERSSMGESLIITRLALRSNSSSNASTSGSQSDISTVLPPCSLRRAGSIKMQSTGEVSLSASTLSLFETIIW